MELFPFITGLLKTDNIAIIVLMVVCAALLYLHIIWRKEEREDRKAWMDVLSKNADALNGVKLAIASITGKTL